VYSQVLHSVYKLVRSCPEHVFQFVRNEQPQLLSQLVLAFRALQGSAARLGKLTALTRSLVRVLIACAEQHSTLALASAPAGSEPIEVAKEASRSYFSLLINLLLHSSEAVRFTTSATAGALLLASAAPSRGSRSGTGGDECGSGARAAGATASALPTGHVTPPPTRSVTGPGIGGSLGGSGGLSAALRAAAGIPSSALAATEEDDMELEIAISRSREDDIELDDHENADDGGISSLRARAAGGLAALSGAARSAGGVREVQFCCDVCGTCPIVGVRWQCDVCQDFDICDSCYQSVVELDVPPHTPDHELVRIEITMPLEAPAVPALAYPARAAPAAVAASKQPMEVSLAQ
jgi:hypothetical protein